MMPASVSRTTQFAAIVFTSALSKGSALATGAGVGRELIFAGEGCCASAMVESINRNANPLASVLCMQFYFRQEKEAVKVKVVDGRTSAGAGPIGAKLSVEATARVASDSIKPRA